MLSQIDVISDSNEKSAKMKELLYSISEATTQAISLTIESIKTPNAIVNQQHFILDFLANCDRNTYELIKNHSMDLKQKSELKPLQIKCVACGHEYQQRMNLNMSDFFGTGF
jgi:hypothetical protein